MRPRLNYRMKDGDRVELLKPARVDGYWYCPDTMSRGSWDRMHLLPGCVGVVIKARTPCVVAGPNDPLYFANVDIPYGGTTHRVRVFHSDLRRMP